ncbi:MAG: hypothetical protein AB1925_30350 [Actinomycetota bacterium]
MSDSAKDIDQLLAEWEDLWLKSLWEQILVLHHRRQIHDEFVALLDRQHHSDVGFLRDVVHRMYIESQASAIRRLGDSDRRKLSLRRLIGQLEEHRTAFTRTVFVQRWMDRANQSGGVFESMAHADFDQFTDQPGDEDLSCQLLQRDRNQLSDITKEVVDYANAVVAHASADPSGAAVTYAEFNAAIDLLGEMLKRYYLLINGGGLTTATPTIQGDWIDVFRRPLL